MTVRARAALRALAASTALAALPSCSLNYLKDSDDTDSVPEFVFYRASFERVQDGNRMVQMGADKIEQYKVDNVSFAQNAEFRTYSNEGELQAEGACAYISADMNNDEYVLLGGISLSLPGQDMKILGDSLKIDKQGEQIVSGTDSEISLVRDDIAISGRGFSASGISKRYSFLGDVSGSIETGAD